MLNAVLYPLRSDRVVLYRKRYSSQISGDSTSDSTRVTIQVDSSGMNVADLSTMMVYMVWNATLSTVMNGCKNSDGLISIPNAAQQDVLRGYVSASAGAPIATGGAQEYGSSGKWYWKLQTSNAFMTAYCPSETVGTWNADNGVVVSDPRTNKWYSHLYGTGFACMTQGVGKAAEMPNKLWSISVFGGGGSTGSGVTDPTAMRMITTTNQDKAIGLAVDSGTGDIFWSSLARHLGIQRSQAPVLVDSR